MVLKVALWGWNDTLSSQTFCFWIKLSVLYRAREFWKVPQEARLWVGISSKGVQLFPLKVCSKCGSIWNPLSLLAWSVWPGHVSLVLSLISCAFRARVCVLWGLSLPKPQLGTCSFKRQRELSPTAPGDTALCRRAEWPGSQSLRSAGSYKLSHSVPTPGGPEDHCSPTQAWVGKHSLPGKYLS